MANIPDRLLAEIISGRTVLFLGAGASIGAANQDGDKIASGQGLAEKIAARFLGPEYENLPFKTVYDYACAEHDVLSVQRFLYDYLYPFEPASFHDTIPLLPWSGVVGTNYDLVIERAYARSKKPIQSLEVNRSDLDQQDLPTADSLLYIKLHGCITQHQVIHPPLIASTDQLISFRDGRNGQFDTFLEWAKTKTIVFCGYSFDDPNLRILLDQIVKEGDGRPTHYIVNKTILPAQKKYWSDRRFDAVALTFEDFIGQVDAAFPPAKRELATLRGSNTFHTPLAKFINVQGRSESAALRSYLESSIELLSENPVRPPVNAVQFYKGFELGWGPAANDLDVRLPIVNEVLAQEVLPSSAGTRLVVIKGHAGSGKSVTLRRICYEAATKHGKLCLFASRLSLIDEKYFQELFSLTTERINLFVDNVSHHKNSIARVIRLAKQMKANLLVICSESYNLWNVNCDDLEPLVSNEYTMRYLSEDDIEHLLLNLKTHNSLGYLSTLSIEKQREELKHVHGRQILVALLEATHGRALQDIVVSEYKSIVPKEAQQLYLDICSLHRLGPPVRAGLISRVHNISFEEFEEKLFKPLEGIVKLRKEPRSGDYVFEARHSEIATVLYDLVLTDPNERFDNIVRIISKLNPAYSFDLEAISRLLRADTVRATVPDEAKARQVYDVAMEAMGELPFLLHQRGMYELTTANNLGRLNQAESYLRRAHELEAHNRSIQHSLAELDLKRSRVATDPLERLAWRRSSEERAAVLASHGTSPYPFHTLLKAAVDEVRDALTAVENNDDESAVRHLSDSITSAEGTLKRAYEKFPNDPMLLAEEGILSQVLSEAGRAERAFEKSFEANPRSTLMAQRLARIKRSKHDFSGAIDTLRTSLEHNPAARDINYELAQVLIESAHDGDQVNSDEILYRLRRSFSPGDKQIRAQFWYARQLVLADEYPEAKNLFAKLAHAPISFSEKTELQGIVLDVLGAPRKFSGTITSLNSTYGFVRCDGPNFDAFFAMIGLPEGLEPRLSLQKRVRFELAFTLRGPQAINLEI